MKKTINILTSLLLLFSSACAGQQQKRSEDELIFDDYISTVKEIPEKELFLHTANYFLGTPYVGGTLEINEEEQLVVNLRELDCVTFVENCMALSATALSGEMGFDAFKENLQQIRYRGGIIDAYPSRLHYTTDWIYNNTKAGVLYDKTKEIGGVELPVNVHYISKHVELEPEVKEEIIKTENEINSREGVYYYIPKKDIDAKSHLIQSGDIICFTTNIEGLDTQHVGIAYRENQNDALGLMHASSREKVVVIDPLTLHEYCQRDKKISGIIVLQMR